MATLCLEAVFASTFLCSLIHRDLSTSLSPSIPPMIQGNSRTLNDRQILYGMNIQKSNQTVIPCQILPRSQGSAKEENRKKSLKSTHTFCKWWTIRCQDSLLKFLDTLNGQVGFYALKTFSSPFYSNLDFRSVFPLEKSSYVQISSLISGKIHDNI